MTRKPCVMTQSKKRWLFIVIICIGNSIMAQTNSWTTYYQSDQILVEYSTDKACNYGDILSNAEYVFLKVTNQTNATIQLQYHLDIYYQGEGCATCSNDEYKYTISVPAHQSIEAGCDYTAKGLSKLAIFKKYTDKPNRRIFEKFELTQIILQ